MAGTGGNLIVREVNQIDGYVQPITIGGTVNFTFVNLASSITIHNITNDFIQVAVTTVPASTGNGFIIIAPQSAQSLSNPPEAIIQEIDVTDLGLTTNGGGWVICNSFFN